MTPTNNQILLLLALVYLSEVVHQISSVEVTQKIQNKQVLISIGSGNYALASDVLLVNNWETLSINGNSVEIVKSTCERESKPLSALNKSEQTVIDFLKNGFKKMNPSNPSKAQIDHFVTKEGWTLSRIDSENLIATDNRATELAHIIVNRDHATFVHLNEKIDMIPFRCLNQMQQALVEQIKLELEAQKRNLSHSADEIRQIRLSSNQLINASGTNYALSSSSLLGHDWKTASINGNIVSIYTQSCEHILKDLSTIDVAELKTIRDAVTKLERARPWSGDVYGLMKFRMSPAGQHEFNLVSGVNINLMNHIQGNQLFVSKMDANNYSISREDLPAKRVFINDDIATFVYKSNFIEMMPIKCVSGVELGALNDARTVLEESNGYMKKSNNQ